MPDLKNIGFTEEEKKQYQSLKTEQAQLDLEPVAINTTGSQYDAGFVLPRENTLEALQENRSLKQTRLDKWANAVPRLISKTGTEIAKTPAYTYALGEAILTDATLPEALNNSWLKYLDDFDKSVKEQVPIYTPKAVKDGDIWDNLQSTSFYTDEGVDGLGYLLAYTMPGAALRGVNLAGKLSKIGIGANLAKNLELGTATVINTTLESLGESKGLIDGLRPELEKQYAAKIEFGQITPEEAQKQINEKLGNAGKESFFTNFALIAGPNFLMNKNLLGRFIPTKTALTDIINDAGKFVTPEQLTKKQITKNYLSKILGAGVSEGFIEEGSQFAIENYEKNFALGKTSSPLIQGLMDSYADALSTTEGQKSIFLGAFLGSIGGVAGEYGQADKEFKQKSELYNTMQKNFDGFASSKEDIFDKNSDGSLVLDTDGTPIINKQKAANYVANIIKEQQSSDLKDAYAALNNKEGYDYISNQEFTRFAIPYLQQEGGLDLLNQHIDQLSSKLIENEKAIRGIDNTLNEQQHIQELKQKAKKLSKVVDSVNNTLLVDFTPKTKEEVAKYNQFTNSLKNTAIQETSKQQFLVDRINRLTAQADLLRLSPEKDLPQNLKEVEDIEKQTESYKKSLEQSIKEYKNIFDKKEQKKAFNDYLEEENAQEADIINNEVEQVVQSQKPIVEEKPIVQIPQEKLQVEKYSDSLEKEKTDLKNKLSSLKGTEKTKARKRLKEINKEQAKISPWIQTINKAKEVSTPFTNTSKANTNDYSKNKKQSNIEFIQAKLKVFPKMLKVKTDEELNLLYQEIKENYKKSLQALSIEKYNELKKVSFLTQDDIDDIHEIIKSNEKKLQFIEDEILARELKKDSNNRVFFMEELSESGKQSHYVLQQKELEDAFKNNSVENVSENGKEFTIRGEKYFNLHSEPLNAINRNEKGDIASVSLTNSKNKTVTFTQDRIKDEVAFAILSTEVLLQSDNIITDVEQTDEIIDKNEDITKETILQDLIEIQETIDILKNELNEEYKELVSLGFSKKEVKDHLDKSIKNQQLEDLKDIQKNLNKEIKNIDKLEKAATKTIKLIIQKDETPEITREITPEIAERIDEQITSRKESDTVEFAEKIITGKVENTPEEVEFYENNKAEIKEVLKEKQAQEERKPEVTTTDAEQTPTVLQVYNTAKAQTNFKDTSVEFNNAEEKGANVKDHHINEKSGNKEYNIWKRAFNITNKANFKFLAITPNNHPKLHDEIADKGFLSKDLPKDKEGKVLMTDVKGGKGGIIFVVVERVGNKWIPVKLNSKYVYTKPTKTIDESFSDAKAYTAFRETLLYAPKPLLVSIESKTQGNASRYPSGTKNPVFGTLSNSTEFDDLSLVIPITKGEIIGQGFKIPANGVGRLWATKKNSIPVDLFARTLNQQDADTAYLLIEKLLSPNDNKTEDYRAALENLILIGLDQQENRRIGFDFKSYSNITIGNQQFSLKDVQNNEQLIKDFLKTKYRISKNSELQNSGEFTTYENKKGELTKVIYPNYKTYLLTATSKEPAFSTDVEVYNELNAPLPEAVGKTTAEYPKGIYLTFEDSLESLSTEKDTAQTVIETPQVNDIESTVVPIIEPVSDIEAKKADLQKN